MDFASVSATLKVAYDAGKAIVAAGPAIASAELKLQLAEMMGSLATARNELIEANEEAKARDAEIERLKAAFEERAELVRYGDGLYKKMRQGSRGAAPIVPIVGMRPKSLDF